MSRKIVKCYEKKETIDENAILLTLVDFHAVYLILNKRKELRK